MIDKLMFSAVLAVFQPNNSVKGGGSSEVIRPKAASIKDEWGGGGILFTPFLVHVIIII